MAISQDGVPGMQRDSVLRYKCRWCEKSRARRSDDGEWCVLPDDALDVSHKTPLRITLETTTRLSPVFFRRESPPVVAFGLNRQKTITRMPRPPEKRPGEPGNLPSRVPVLRQRKKQAKDFWRRL